MNTFVEIKGVKIYANHGVMPQETRVGNLFEVSARLCYDFEEAAAADDISKALNYAEAVELMEAVMATPRRLLESVAMDIRDTLQARWPAIKGGSVKVAKLHPPFTTKVDHVAVEIEW
ncbi:MAG: dihydroneopterin aldolase [Muribaculaceae bacterium]